MIARPILRCARALSALLASVLVALISHGARAEPAARPSLLLGGMGPPPAPVVTRDPRLPSGARVERASRPTSHVSVACGLAEPVCVLHEASLEPTLVLAYVDALEAARAQLVEVLGLPAPMPDA